METAQEEVIVVGSGPNGLAAAIEMARNGREVTVLEAAETIGGGTRTAELTLPGFLHDVCSAIHPLGVASPFFNTLPLGRHGLQWIDPPAALAHPFDDGTAALLEREIFGTAETLDFPDHRPYVELMAPLKESWQVLAPELLAPLHFPVHPVLMARFGLHAVRSAERFAAATFQGERARALFAGMAAHSFLPLHKPATAAFGLILGRAGARGRLAGGRRGLRGVSAKPSPAISVLSAAQSSPEGRSGTSTSCPVPLPSCWTLPPDSCSGSPATGSTAATGRTWRGIATGPGYSRSTGH